MTNVIIETDRYESQLYEWLQEDQSARKVTVDRETNDGKQTIVSTVKTGIALWNLTLAIQSFQRSRHADNRPTVWIEYEDLSIDVAEADRTLIDDFYADLYDASSKDGK